MSVQDAMLTDASTHPSLSRRGPASSFLDASRVNVATPPTTPGRQSSMFIAGKSGKELRHTVSSDESLADAAQWRHIQKWTIDLMAAEWQPRRSFVSSR